MCSGMTNQKESGILRGKEIDYHQNLVQKTRKAYEATAEAYIKQHGYSAEMREQADRFMSMMKGNYVLDVGCGPGRDAQYFASKGKKVSGLDITAAFIAEAKKRVPGDFRVGDMRYMPFSDGQFDGVWNCTALFHVLEVDKVMQEQHRVLRHGGILYVSVLNQKEDSLLTGQKYGDGAKFFKGFTQESLCDLVERNGFRIDVVNGNIAPNPRGQLDFLNVYATKK